MITYFGKSYKNTDRIYYYLPNFVTQDFKIHSSFMFLGGRSIVETFLFN